MDNASSVSYQIIMQAFEERKLRNPAYSLRAFARDTGISVAQVSRILGQRRAISTEQACKIALSLKFSPSLFMEFVSSTVET